MKRSILLICLLTMTALLLSACGAREAGKMSAAAAADKATTLTTVSYSLGIDSKTISSIDWNDMVEEQGNRHGLNIFVYDNSWIYGAWDGKNAAGEIVKVRCDNSDRTVIDSNTNGKLGQCQAVKNGYIYYSQFNKDAGSMELIKVRVSGEEAKVIISEIYGSIQITDDYIYYTTKEIPEEDGDAVTEESAHLYRCDLNGEDVEAVIEKPVYYFTVFEDYILYQDNRDNMSLHIYDMISKANHQINDFRSFWPIFDGEYIYYLTDNEEPGTSNYKLWRITTDGSINEEIDVGSYLGGLLVRDDYIYYINKDDSNRIYRCLKDGSSIELVTRDSNVCKMQWVKNSIAYARDDGNGYITGIYLYSYDGGDRIEFCDSDDYWHLY